MCNTTTEPALRKQEVVCFSKIPSQVWDVLQEEALANYRGHVGYLLSVDWSPVDPDVIWTGGKDFTVQEWRVSEQEFTKPPKGGALRLCERKARVPASPVQTSCFPPLREEDGRLEGEDEDHLEAEEEEQEDAGVWWSCGCSGGVRGRGGNQWAQGDCRGAVR